MRDHIRVLGILNIVMGALTASLGLVALVAMGSIAAFIAASLPGLAGDDYHNGVIAAPVMATIGMVAGAFFLALGLPSIIGGWGLIKFKPWSRILMIVVSVFHLFHVPIGTALGVYGFWVLFNDESRRLLESGGAGAVGARYVPAPYGGNPPNYGPPPTSPSM